MIKQGSEVTYLRYGGIFIVHITTNLQLSLGEKMFKIGTHLAKLQAKSWILSHTRCMQVHHTET